MIPAALPMSTALIRCGIFCCGKCRSASTAIIRGRPLWGASTAIWQMISATLQAARSPWCINISTAKSARARPQGLPSCGCRTRPAAVIAEVDRHMNALAFNKALIALWELVSMVNKYIDESAPWALAKDPAQSEHLAAVMAACADALKISALLAAPFMPLAAQKLWEALGGAGPGCRSADRCV